MSGDGKDGEPKGDSQDEPATADAQRLAAVQAAARGWPFRIVASADLKGAGAQFEAFSEGLGAKGGAAFQDQVRGFIDDALAAAGAEPEEGVWQWTGDGALLAFADAARAHEFATALHAAAAAHNRAVRTESAQRRFRVGMAATDDPERESWDYSVMRAVRLESEAPVGGMLVDVETRSRLPSQLRNLYGPEEAIAGKRDDETYPAHRFDGNAEGATDAQSGGAHEAAPDAAPQPPNDPESKETTRTRLHNLPPDAAHFTGREGEAAALLAALKDGGGAQAITALKGIGGIGKSALAVRVARQLALSYPAAQILIDLRGTEPDPVVPMAAMEEIIRRFEPAARLPDDAGAVAEIYRDLLGQNKALLILDNARDGAQVQDLVPPPPSAAIITARRQIDLPGVASHRLDNLERADAVALLMALFAANAPEASVLDGLAAACADHPLSLTVAGTYAANRADRIDLARYAAEIAARRETLRLAGVEGHDVMAALAFSLDRLTDKDSALAERWRDLAVFPADFDTSAVASVWQTDEAQARDGLRRLEDTSFLEPGTGPERYRLHDLMRDLARLGPPADRFAGPQARHGAHYLEVLTAADALYLEGGAEKVLAGLAAYDREEANILAGQARAAAGMKAGDAAAGAAAYAYANAAVHVLELRLHPSTRIDWWETAAVGARRSGNRSAEGVALGNLGLAYDDLGEFAKAIEYYERSLILLRETGDKRGEGIMLGNLGITYKNLGETAKAIEYHEQSLVVAREIADRRAEGNALGNLGNAHERLGETAKAIEYHDQALVVSRETGDRRAEGQDLGNLGVAYAVLGETAKAIEYQEQRLEIAREIGDRRGEGNALGNLGVAYKNLGEIAKAIEYYDQQLTIAREIGDRRGEGNALNNTGSAYKELGRIEAARAAWTAALAVKEAIGDPSAENVRAGLAALDG